MEFNLSHDQIRTRSSNRSIQSGLGQLVMAVCPPHCTQVQIPLLVVYSSKQNISLSKKQKHTNLHNTPENIRHRLRFSCLAKEVKTKVLNSITFYN